METFVLANSNTSTTYFVVNKSTIGEIIIDRRTEVVEGKIKNLKKSTPISYIRYVELDQSNSDLLVVYGKDSSMIYKFKDKDSRKKASEVIATNGSVKDITVGKDSVYQVIKRPVIAFLVVLAISIWSYATALELESGHGGGDHLVIILLVAGIGSVYIPYIAGILICIVVYRIYYLISKRDSITRIYFR
jgi:hypothetical protein